MDLKQMICPACESDRLVPTDDGRITCEACGALYEVEARTVICKDCKTENPAQAKRCMECGAALGKLCPVCGHTNPARVERCEECRSPLDALAAVTARMGEGRRRSEAIMKERLVSTKVADDDFMTARRQQLEAEERERLARLAAQKKAAAEEQKMMLYIAAGVGVAVIALGLLIVIVIGVL